jgi:large subunit ribosomal protein L21
MYAVIETGGKQYRVEYGLEIQVERLDVEAGQTIDLERVLLVADADWSSIGRPLVDGAKVSAEVVRQDRADKVVVFKYKPKARRRVKKGHRQDLTVLRISEIAVDGHSAAADAASSAAAAKAASAAADAAAAEKAQADKLLAARLAAPAPKAGATKPGARRSRKAGDGDDAATGSAPASTAAGGGKATSPTTGKASSARARTAPRSPASRTQAGPAASGKSSSTPAEEPSGRGADRKSPAPRRSRKKDE